MACPGAEDETDHRCALSSLITQMAAQDGSHGGSDSRVTLKLTASSSPWGHSLHEEAGAALSPLWTSGS